MRFPEKHLRQLPQKVQPRSPGGLRMDSTRRPFLNGARSVNSEVQLSNPDIVARRRVAVILQS